MSQVSILSTVKYKSLTDRATEVPLGLATRHSDRDSEVLKHIRSGAALTGDYMHILSWTHTDRPLLRAYWPVIA